MKKGFSKLMGKKEPRLPGTIKQVRGAQFPPLYTSGAVDDRSSGGGGSGDADTDAVAYATIASSSAAPTGTGGVGSCACSVHLCGFLHFGRKARSGGSLLPCQLRLNLRVVVFGVHVQ